MAVEVTFLPGTNVSNINTNFQRVKDALEEVVGRTGDLPNHMNADLDMNDNDILNVKSIDADAIYLDGTPIIDITAVEQVLQYTPEIIAVANISDEVVTVANNMDDINEAIDNMSSIIAAPNFAAQAEAAAELSSDYADEAAASAQAAQAAVSRGLTSYYTASGTFTKNPDTISIDIICVGGGGGSSGCQGGSAQASLGNSGAAGAEAHKHLDLLPRTITNITQANPGVVTSNNHGFTNGTVIRITDVVGMTQLNGNTYTIANTTANTFQLSGTNTTGFSAYISGGKFEFISCPLTVGAAGLAGIGGDTPTAGGDGGTSSLNGYCSAAGGDGGTITGVTAAGTSAIQSNSNIGGTTGVGDLIIPGANSNRGLRVSGTVVLSSNSGANHRFGRGGRAVAGGSDGFPGDGYGSGAGGPTAGDTTHRNGAAGAPGLVIITENF